MEKTVGENEVLLRKQYVAGEAGIQDVIVKKGD